ncbi:MAG: hypothetical protein A2Y38_13975 [Spirochaetes bacterium GWB1_59_5]|nr:MAG: hypothetical protein A2Y38_13975 [Spirochaetes bacterium GWB1_59_5]
MQPISFFKSFRFLICVSYTNGDERWAPATMAYTSPFDGCFWVAAGHSPDRPTLHSLLVEAQNVAEVTAWLLPAPGGQMARSVAMHFDEARSYPLDLDAHHGDVSLEWVALSNVRFAPTNAIRNVPIEEAPLEVQKCADPRQRFISPEGKTP